jgi:signal transduction histidine kinase
MPRSRFQTPPARPGRGARRCRTDRRCCANPSHLLADLRQCLPTGLELPVLLPETVRGAATLLRAPAASLWRVDEASGMLHMGAFWSATADQAGLPSTVRLDQDALGWVARHRQLLNVSDLYSETRFSALDCWRQRGWHSFIGLPMLIEDKLFAVLACHGVQPFLLCDTAHGLLDTFIAHVAIALQHAVLYATETTARRAAEASASAQASLAIRQASLYATETVARASIEAATRAKDAFLANMSHELRTPLNAIINYSELLQEEVTEQGHGAYVADLQKIHTAGKRLLQLINDILDFARIESGKVALSYEAFSVRCLVYEMAATLQPGMAQQDNTLEVHIADDVEMLHTDRLKVQQSLWQLLSNACKFTSHGRIALKAASETADGQSWIQFQVCDTGIGMSPAQLANLFQPFTPGDDTPTRRYGGTGLGLAMSQRLCQLLGGEITVVSTLGQGSTFTMRLPVHASPSCVAS